MENEIRSEYFPVKYLPSWMPGAGFKRHALKTKKAVQVMFNKPFEMVTKQRVCTSQRIDYATIL